MKPVITFLIPGYKRVDGAVNAALSILSQCNMATKYLVEVWINDDCSPNIDISEVKSKLECYSDHASILVTQNSINFGMSKNILYMVSNVKSSFWTVLTDDDILLPGSLDSIIKALKLADIISVSSLFTPRYCFKDNGAFLFKDVPKGTLFPSIIRRGPVNAMKFIKNAHVLTGMIISANHSLSLWEANRDNAYFPMINFGSLVLSENCLAIDHEWFCHTINNTTHWEGWGGSEKEIANRLGKDYLLAFAIIKKTCLDSCTGFLERTKVYWLFYEHLYTYFTFTKTFLALRTMISIIKEPSFFFPMHDKQSLFVIVSLSLLSKFLSHFYDFTMRTARRVWR